MRRRSFLRVVVLGAVLIGIGLASSPKAVADYETVLHSVQYYGGTGECPGADMTHTCCSPTESYYGQWFDAFYSDYDYDQLSSRFGTSVKKRYWLPSNDQDDPEGTDFADAIFFYGRGDYDCDTQYREHSIVRMGSDADGCYVDLPGDPSFGNGGAGEDGNILVAIADNLAQLCVWQANAFLAMRGGNQFSAFAGYHGTHHSGLWDISEFDDYLDLAEFEDIGDEWVGQMYNYNLWSGDDCAVFIIWAGFEADADDYYYHSGYKDFHGTLEFGVSKYYYHDGCDPDDGTEL